MKVSVYPHNGDFVDVPDQCADCLDTPASYREVFDDHLCNRCYTLRAIDTVDSYNPWALEYDETTEVRP